MGNQFLRYQPLFYALYKFQKILIILAILVIIIWLIRLAILQDFEEKFIKLSVIFVGVLLTIAIVAVFKDNTTYLCPWYLKPFGGTHDSIPLLSLFDVNQYGRNHCFPAGHASGSYGWLALPFILFPLKTPQFRKWMSLVIGISFSFTVVQNLRGAHFISHDFITISLALFSTYLSLLFHNFLMKKRNICL